MATFSLQAASERKRLKVYDAQEEPANWFSMGEGGRPFL